MKGREKGQRKWRNFVREKEKKKIDKKYFLNDEMF
jgi:hypothetical protein